MLMEVTNNNCNFLVFAEWTFGLNGSPFLHPPPPAHKINSDVFIRILSLDFKMLSFLFYHKFVCD